VEATFVRDLDGFAGSARLWQTSEPYSYPDDRWGDEGEPLGTTTYVVSSAANAYGGPETFLFPSDEGGNVLDWLELSGSVVGALDHERAINGFIEAHNAQASV
jgi:hypothetical protein